MVVSKVFLSIEVLIGFPLLQKTEFLTETPRFRNWNQEELSLLATAL